MKKSILNSDSNSDSDPRRERLRDLLQDSIDFLERDGFGHVVVHPGLETAIAVPCSENRRATKP